MGVLWNSPETFGRSQYKLTPNDIKWICRCDFLEKHYCALDLTFRPFRRRREMLQWPTLWFPHSPFALWGGEQRIKFWTMRNWVTGWWYLSICFNFHPYPWGSDPIWEIPVEWVETTNWEKFVFFPVERQPFPGGPLALRMRQERFYAISIGLVLSLTLFPSRFILSWQVPHIFLQGPNRHEALSRVLFGGSFFSSTHWSMQVNPPVDPFACSVILSKQHIPSTGITEVSYFCMISLSKEMMVS